MGDAAVNLAIAAQYENNNVKSSATFNEYLRWAAGTATAVPYGMVHVEARGMWPGLVPYVLTQTLP
jgi:hypothetical protein